MNDVVAEFCALQSGVVSRSQLLAAGAEPHDIRRMIRRRELAPVHPGVYVNHTGELTWLQRGWAGVLYAWPAALCHRSAIRALDGPGRSSVADALIHVAIERTRGLTVPDGVVIHQLAALDRKAMWNTSPPRLRVEEALIDIAAESTRDFDAVARLANAIQGRQTTPARLQAALNGRSRIARRAFLNGVLADLDEGTCSVLEHGYLTRVERPHGLPRGRPSARPGHRAESTKTFATRGTAWSSSWTGDCSTTTLPPTIATLTVTWMPSSVGGSPCGSAGGRCSHVPASPRSGSACSSSSAAGKVRSGRARIVTSDSPGFEPPGRTDPGPSFACRPSLARPVGARPGRGR